MQHSTHQSRDHMAHDQKASEHKHPNHTSHYGRLALMTLLSFIAMYVLMYAMVDRAGNVFPNVNQAYMAGLMAAPMLLIELGLMRRMYPNRAANLAFVAAGLAVMLGCWIGIRQQAAVSDQQFLRSMIPHHAGALLMCREARLQSPDLRQLCREIRESQQREIDFMRARLD